MTSSKLHYLPKAPPRGIRASACEFWGDTNIQSITHGGSYLLFNITFSWACHILGHCRPSQAHGVLPLTWSVEGTHPTQLHGLSSPTRGKGQQWSLGGVRRSGIQAGARYQDPVWAESPPWGTYHCPIKLYYQNTDSKTKVLRILRQPLQSIKPRAQDALLSAGPCVIALVTCPGAGIQKTQMQRIQHP